MRIKTQATVAIDFIHDKTSGVQSGFQDKNPQRGTLKMHIPNRKNEHTPDVSLKSVSQMKRKPDSEVMMIHRPEPGFVKLY